jgi:Protein of unknown function (DUF1559)
MGPGQNTCRTRCRRLGLAGVALLGVVTVALGPLNAVPIKKQKEKQEYVKDPKLIKDQLKEIGLALHNYHDTFRHFPTPAICDNKGKPLLSWRVAILPYLEEDVLSLYKEFKVDEPWDSKHNKALLKKIPKVYAPPGLKTKNPFSTFYQPFVGKRAAFEPNQRLRIVHFPDGLSDTVMVVEAGEAVPWTKPDDLPYDPKKPLPRLGGMCKDGFHALFGDGSVKFIKKKVDPKILHALITRDGGEVIEKWDKWVLPEK